MLPFEPYIVRCAGHGMLLVIRRYRVWSIVITRNASQVCLKRIRNAELEYDGKEWDHPDGIAAVAGRFMSGASTTIKRELENIVKQYTSKSNARRALAKIGDYALSKSDEFILRNADNGYDLDDVGAERYQYDCVVRGQTTVNAERNKPKTNRVHKAYVIVQGADFSNRKGGFRLTLDAIASGLKTADLIHAYVCTHKAGYKIADIYSDISVGKRNGYIQGD